MNKSLKSFVRKQFFTTIYLLVLSLMSCSEKNHNNNLPIPSETPTMIENLLTPDHLIWTPTYQQPFNWHINRDNPEISRSTELDGEVAEIRVYFVEFAGNDLSPKILRDNLYEQRKCQGDMTTSPVDCQKGFVKITQSIGGYPAEILRYYGTWRDSQQEVNEVYLIKKGETLHFTCEGDFQKISTALTTILPSIEWSLEKPTPGFSQEPEEFGL